METAPTNVFDRILQKLLNTVEKAGNRLPHPVTLFLGLIFLVLGVSAILSYLGVSAVHPGTKETIHAVNLLSAAGIQKILTKMVTTFAEFPPLGLVLAVMLGIGVAEKSNLVGTALKGFVIFVPSKLVTISVVTAGMISSLAADAGYVVLIPLGAVIFHSMGRHPIAGLAAAFAGVSGGFGANIFLTSLDPLLAGFTEPAARLIDPAYTVQATANWYFSAASVPLIAIVGTFVTEKILEPRLGEYVGDVPRDNHNELTPTEKSGLWWAFLIGTATCVAFVFIAHYCLRDPDGGFGPLYKSLIAIMIFLFLLPGLAFGMATGSIKNDKDVAKMLGDSMSHMGGYIVLAFVAAQFVAFFSWSNIGVIFAITGANLLKSIGFTGLPLIVTFVLISSFINILIGSASAKWAIMAPIFVPMLMLMGYSPELTQAAYRIGDSYTNILTPLLPYFPLVISFAHKYDKNMGIGSLISCMLPYSVFFCIARILMLILWLLAGLPVGPGAGLHYLTK
jgi:aminobenzoyl-glutamate transport protein